MNPGTRQMVVISAAGPLTGLAVGLAIVALVPMLPPDGDARRLVDDALLVTIGLSLLNLVPLGPFDGNRVLSGLVATATGGPPGVAGRVLGAVLRHRPDRRCPCPRHDISRDVPDRHRRARVALHDRPHRAVRRIAVRGRAVPTWGGRATRSRAPTPSFAAVPGDVRAQLVRATALAAMTRYPEAEAAYGAILEHAPGDLQALAGRSAARRALGRREEADR